MRPNIAHILTFTLAGGFSLIGAVHVFACELPPPQCEVRPGQVATLAEVNGRYVIFDQYSPDASVYAPVQVLVGCDNRLAVAFGPVAEVDLESGYAGSRVMSEALHSDSRVSLRKVHRQLRRLGLDSRRFKLPADHCGCDLPSIPPPPVSCPNW